MMSNTEKKIINVIYENIINNCEFPDFGSPETRCDKCMFYRISCHPSSDYVGCYHGWKREEE